MNVEYHKTWSTWLEQDMELKVYGHAGKPVLVFPCQGGRFYEYEDFGMIEPLKWFINEGKIKIFTVDSVDNQSWANWDAHPADRARRHDAYDHYVYDEVVPFIQGHGQPTGKILTTGSSMGAYHCTNFFFRHPDVCDGVIALSGLMSLEYFIGDYMDDTVYLHTPLAYLPKLEDPWYLEKYRQSKIIVCVGQGAWEELMLADARALKRILDEKDIPCWIDFWGHDVNHDWPWWRLMTPYFIGKIFES